MEQTELQRAIEAILFAAGERVDVSRLAFTLETDENEIIAHTAQGNLIIRGTGLHIGKLTLDSGEVSVDGLVRELCYEEAAPVGGFWSKLFG